MRNMTLAEWCLVVAVVALLGVVVGVAVKAVLSEKIVLVKADWTCTKHKTETVLMPMIVGNQTYVLPQVHEACISYQRN